MILLQAQQGGSSMWIWMIVILVVMWILMMRPQRKKEKEEQKFRNELKKGDRVEVSVDTAICSGERSASFVFDPATTITRSIQANQVGYLPDGPKVAYLGFWLGSFPETVKKAEKFDYTPPPTAAEAYFVPPAADAAGGNEVGGLEVWKSRSLEVLRFHFSPMRRSSSGLNE